MQTIIIKLNPGKLKNPDLDLRYLIPECIEKVSNGRIRDNGYDYLDDGSDSMCIWLETESAMESYPIVEKLFMEKEILGNNLALSAEIYISENDSEDIEKCTLVFPK